MRGFSTRVIRTELGVSGAKQQGALTGPSPTLVQSRLRRWSSQVAVDMYFLRLLGILPCGGSGMAGGVPGEEGTPHCSAPPAPMMGDRCVTAAFLLP
jgi:hypothetical protein